jgi:precorrin-2/cobalt-factor-2 C20-methyltransferase
LTIGDPTVFSTYNYLHTIISSRGYTTRIIPGVTSFCAAAAALGQPLCERDETLHIIPANYNAKAALSLDGTKVLMKSGKKQSEVIEMLREKGLNAKIAQRVGMDGEQLYDDLKQDVESDYFSIIIVKD